MRNILLMDQYDQEGIVVETAQFRNANKDNREPVGSDDYMSARKKVAERFLSIAGESVSKTDFPANFDPRLSAKILDSFSPDERKTISQMALFHEATPGHEYWMETRKALMPMLGAHRAGYYASTKEQKGTIGTHLEDVAAVISRRDRNRSTMRGEIPTRP